MLTKIHQIACTKNISNDHRVENFGEKGPFVFERSKNNLKMGEKRVNEWSMLQKRKYLAFIYYYQQQFTRKTSKQLWDIYKLMQKFIKNRNSNQCRIYHQSMLKKYTNLQGIILNAKLQNLNLAEISQIYEKQLLELKNESVGSLKYVVLKGNIKQQFQSHILIQEKKGQRQCQDKKDDLDNIKTDLTFNEGQQGNGEYCPLKMNMMNENYNKINHRPSFFNHFQKNQTSFSPPHNPLNHHLSTYAYPFHCPTPINAEKLNREAEWRECHEMFLIWTSKLKNLLQDEQ